MKLLAGWMGAGALVLMTSLVGCSGKKDCSNGECACDEGGSCDFTCEAPPCHVDCAGDNPSCTGTCGNATCTCGEGSNCDFLCDSGPCHVDCQGGNDECSGTCANGTCYCAATSHCDFDCLDDNCKFDCDGTCVVTCAPGTQGTTCQVNSCASGTPELCADGTHIACGESCPPPSSSGE